MNKRNSRIRAPGKQGPTRAKRRSLGSLHFFVDFLNAESPKELSRWEPEPNEPSTEASVAALWPMRDEVRRDLSCMTDSPRRGAMEELGILVDKINGLGLVPWWNVWPARRNLFVIDGHPVPNPGWKPGRHRNLKTGKHKFIVSMWFNDSADPRKFLYGTVIEALQSGILTRIKRCQWEDCGRYFLREDLRRIAYCSERCANAYDRWDAAERVRKSRERARNSE
jgi:hypothetical protein